MVGAVTSGYVAPYQQVSAQKAPEPAAKSAELGPVGSAEEPVGASDLVFKPGAMKDNEAFATIAEAGAEQEQQQAARKQGGLGKYAKTGFDIFSIRQSNAQNQLQALLTSQSLEALNFLAASEGAAADDAGAAEVSVGEGEGSAGGEDADKTSGAAGGSAGSDTGSGSDTGATTDPGADTGTDTGGSTKPGNGNGNGWGKGGVQK